MAKLTKKSYKRRRVVMGLALFMSIALISTGFAAWVISSQSKDNSTGNVGVGVIDDKNIKVVITNKDDLGSFYFEPKEGDRSGRITSKDGDNYENLSITIKGKVNNPSYVGSLTVELVEVANEIDGKITPKAKEDSGLYKAAQANFIGTPACFYDPQAITLSSTNETSVDFSYTITFEWGSLFGNKNPGEYFDEDEVGKAIDDATMMERLVELRSTIYGTTGDTSDPLYQNTSVEAPKYAVIVTATPK